MPVLDLLAAKLDLLVRPGNTDGVLFTAEDDLTNRTFTASWGDAVALTVDVDADTIAVSWTELQSLALTRTVPWKLTETTGGLTQDVVAGIVAPRATGTTRRTSANTVLLVNGERWTVTAAAGAGGGSGDTPATALTFDGEPLTFDGEPLLFS